MIASASAIVTAENLRNLPRRLGSSAVTVIGIAGMVVVTVGLLAIAAGFRRAMTINGSATTAIVLASGATGESSSTLDLETVRLIEDAPGIARSGDTVLASADLVTVVGELQPGTRRELNVALRGVQPTELAIHNDVHLEEGRWFRPGTHELVVGAGIARHLPTLAVGRTVHWSGQTWTIVGRFRQRGGVAESEAWCDAEALQQALHREGFYQAVYAKLSTPESFDVLKAALASDRRVQVQAERESDYDAEQSRPLTQTISALAILIGGLMALGILFGAVNTMQAAVEMRTREIATLRALGFTRTPIVCSVLAEAIGLALVGGSLGALLAWALLNGHALYTLDVQSMSQVAFAFAVTPTLMLRGIAVAVAIALVSAVLPAWKAVTRPIPSALRA